MSDHEPITDQDLQEGQDADAGETRHDQEVGPRTTPLGQTDEEQDEHGATPGEG
jgi:hypothetical protein